MDMKTLIEQKKASMTISNTKAEEPTVKIRCELCKKEFEVPEWEYSYRKQTAHPECEEKVRKFKSVGIDPLFWTLPEYKILPGNDVAFKAVEEFIQEEYPTRGLFLFGDAGTGKTHLAVKIAQETKLSTRFIKMPKLLLELRSNFNTPEANQNERIIEKLADVELLIIDDLGAEKMSDWVAETIYLLIDERYGKMKPTIITSNFDLSELSARVGDRVCSRITAMCKLIKLSTKDFRQLR